MLDAGCGPGRDTLLLLDRLPTGRVVALDGSLAMLDQLRHTVGARLGQVELVHADLAQPLPITEPVDAVCSVAAFHWVTDHMALFAHLAAVMRPGARLASDCGGAGNVATVTRAIDVVTGAAEHWEFPGAEPTRERLHAAGFVDVEVRLRPAPFALAGRAAHEYLRTVVLGAHLDDLPPADHDAFVQAVLAALPEPVIDYVRLEITATRSG